jgi:hypothetical protein
MGTKPRKPASPPEPYNRPRLSFLNAGASSGSRELVLRLLRGEALDAVSRESQVPAQELELNERRVASTAHRPGLAEACSRWRTPPGRGRTRPTRRGPLSTCRGLYPRDSRGRSNARTITAPHVHVIHTRFSLTALSSSPQYSCSRMTASRAAPRSVAAIMRRPSARCEWLDLNRTAGQCSGLA